jgi:Uri superfamily endonuclease
MSGDVGGTYALFMVLDEAVTEVVGALGRQRFPKGVHVYAGSAASGLERRLVRHARPVKKVHWHVDRLTVRPEVQVVGAVTFGPGGPDECEIVSILGTLPWVSVTPARFGSSDHDCPGHLVRLGERPELVEMAVRSLEEAGGSWLSFDGIERPGGPE